MARKLFVVSILVLSLILGFSITISAQLEQVEFAPPPLKIVSTLERDQLESTKDVGSRTKLALKLMEARLILAEKENSKQDFDGMFREIGSFHALMDHILEFLDKSNKNKGSVLDNFKRLEIGLRKFVPRLEAIRRELPLRYEDYIRKVMIRLRDARAKATEPLFGETVVPRTRNQL